MYIYRNCITESIDEIKDLIERKFKIVLKRENSGLLNPLMRLKIKTRES